MKRHGLLAAGLTAAALAIIAVKVVFLGYSFATVAPKRMHTVTLGMTFEGHGSPVRLRVTLPPSDFRQEIVEETVSAPGFAFRIEDAPGVRLGVWEADAPKGRRSVGHVFGVRTRRVEYELPASLPIPASYPAEVALQLQPEDQIESAHPEIVAKARELTKGREQDAVAVVRAVYAFVAEGIGSAHFKGDTSALTALRLGEAFCGGKSRLFAALARASNVPARLVGGLLLDSRTKRISHVWVETYLDGEWVPFDALNKHFAVLPEDYLVLYRGDHALFGHTKDIAFDWFFKIKRRLEAPEEAVAELAAHPLSIFHFALTFAQANISMELLKIILMVPVGTIVVVLFRNVVGLQTFGTFMPALMAVAFRDTGFVWGLLGFLLVVALGSGVRAALERLQLMHTPRLAIILTAVVFFILLLGALGVRTGQVDLASVSLFPLALMTLTIERFCLLHLERGGRKALEVTFNSLLVASIAYAVMASALLQTLFLGFPELFLVVIAIYVLLGSWTGLRLIEWWRFRRLLWSST